MAGRPVARSRSVRLQPSSLTDDDDQNSRTFAKRRFDSEELVMNKVIAGLRIREHDETRVGIGNPRLPTNLPYYHSGVRSYLPRSNQNSTEDVLRKLIECVFDQRAVLE
jgi:hypothetical protein